MGEDYRILSPYIDLFAGFGEWGMGWGDLRPRYRPSKPKSQKEDKNTKNKRKIQQKSRKINRKK
jgi:hypothetical protein